MLRGIMFVAVCALLSTPASAQSPSHAEVFVVHGIPGQDVPGAPRDLPVDVSVNGACALPNFRYGQVVGPLSFSPGTYRVAVHFPATGSCTSAAVIGPASIPLAAGENATLLAHLTGTGTLTASKFVNDLRQTSSGRARVVVHHTANAPAVDFYLTTQFGNALATRGLATSVVNGETATLPVAGQSTQLAITAAGQTAAAFGPVGIGLQPNRAYLLYVVGSLANNSLNIIAKDVSELR
jgi:hypothetical protein